MINKDCKIKIKVNQFLNTYFIIYCFLILGFETREAIYPKKIAAEIPPAAAFTPPVNIPKNPILFTSLITPFARLYPKPVRGTVAPSSCKIY